jgi:hypothetical protein
MLINTKLNPRREIVSKKINLEYHSSKESLFINHIQKLQDSITDSHPRIDGDNWDDLSTCIDILKSHALSDELIIRFTKLGEFLQNTGVLIGPFYNALLGLNPEQLLKALKEVSTFKYKLSENVREYLFEQLFADTAASKFNTSQMAELICNFSIPNSKTWAKKATEFMTHLSSLPGEEQKNYSITWLRYAEPEMALELFKDLNIKEYLTPLNAYSQARVIEKIFELKNLKEASDLLGKLLRQIKEFIPEMEPSVQKTFVREAFDLRTTESGAELAKSLLAEVWANLPKMDRSVSEYIESNNYFTTSPKKYDLNYNILSDSFSPNLCRLLAQKANTDNNLIKQLILSGNRYFKEIANNVIYSFPGTHLNGEIIKTLILTRDKVKILESFSLTDIHSEKEQQKLIKDIISLWHAEKELQNDIFDILERCCIPDLGFFFPKALKAFIEELFDAKGMGTGNFTAFSKGNYELLTKLLPQIINLLNSADSEIQDLFLAKIFALRKDDYAYLGLPQVLLTLSDQIICMYDEMPIKFINKVINFTSLRMYEIPLKKQIYLKLANSLHKITTPEATNLFTEHLIEIILHSKIIKITIEEVLSSQTQSNKIIFMSCVKDLIISDQKADTTKEIWIQIGKSLQNFEKSLQIKFLEYSGDLIKLLKPKEFVSFEPFILEIKKLINGADPVIQLIIFNKFKQTEISKMIFPQSLKISKTNNFHKHLEMQGQKWFMKQLHENPKSPDLKELFSCMETPLKQKFVSTLLNSEAIALEDFLPIISSDLYCNLTLQKTVLFELFNNSKSNDYNYLSKFLQILSDEYPICLKGFETKKYIDKVKIFECYKKGTISDELYQTIIEQLGGKDKFFDPSLKLVILQDIDPVVKKLFDKTVYSKDIEGRLHDIALTLDSLIKTDTSGLMRTILEAADLPGQFLMQNDVFSAELDSIWWGYSKLQEVVICSMERQNNLQLATTIIDELTHKLLKFIFQNSSNPYYYGDRLSLEKSSSLAQILKQFEPLSQKHSLFSRYNKDKWSIEVISHLFQDLAEQILTGEASKSILVLSEKLNNWVKDYLKQEIQDFDAAYEVLGSKILTEYSSQPKLFKYWSQERINKELEKISNIQKIADQESTDSFDITGTILGYLGEEETALEVAGES